MKVIFFAAVYNQIRELPAFLDEVAASGMARGELLLVNNGSTDGSEIIVKKSGYPILDISSNRGVGYAYIRALDWALERRYDAFGTIATNSKMLPAERGRVLDPVIRGEVDYVTGSRFLPGGDSPNLPSFRRRSIPLVNAFVRLCTRETLSDATCGYRAFRLDILRRAEFDWHASWLYTYGLEYYLYAKVLLDERLRWMEVPITMRYPASGPYSKIRAGRDWYAMLKPWMVARLDGRGFRPE